jgi:hypothetical protein
MTDARFFRMGEEAQDAVARELYGHSGEVERNRREAAQYEKAGREVPAHLRNAENDGGEAS